MATASWKTTKTMSKSISLVRGKDKRNRNDNFVKGAKFYVHY